MNEITTKKQMLILIFLSFTFGLFSQSEPSDKIHINKVYNIGFTIPDSAIIHRGTDNTEAVYKFDENNQLIGIGGGSGYSNSLTSTQAKKSIEGVTCYSKYFSVNFSTFSKHNFNTQQIKGLLSFHGNKTSKIQEVPLKEFTLYLPMNQWVEDFYVRGQDTIRYRIKSFYLKKGEQLFNFSVTTPLLSTLIKEEKNAEIARINRGINSFEFNGKKLQINYDDEGKFQTVKLVEGTLTKPFSEEDLKTSFYKELYSRKTRLESPPSQSAPELIASKADKQLVELKLANPNWEIVADSIFGIKPPIIITPTN